MKRFTMGLAALAAGAMLLAAPVRAAEAGDMKGMDMKSDMKSEMKSDMKSMDAKGEGKAKAADDMDCCKAAEKAGMVCMMCDPSAKAAVGKPAVSFMAKDQTGKMQTLSDNKGKVVVLAWFNPDCPVVQRHLKEGSYQALATSFPKDKVTVLFVDSTASLDPGKEKTVLGENNLGAQPVVLDRTGSIGHAYGATNTPQIYVIDQNGKLAYDGAIDNNPRGDMAPDKVEHYGIDAVKALLAGNAVKTPTSKAYGCSVKYAKKMAEAAGPKTRELAMALACDGGGCGGDKGGEPSPTPTPEPKG